MIRLIPSAFMASMIADSDLARLKSGQPKCAAKLQLSEGMKKHLTDAAFCSSKSLELIAVLAQARDLSLHGLEHDVEVEGRTSIPSIRQQLNSP